MPALMPAFAQLLGKMSEGERRRAWLPPQRTPRDGDADDDAVPAVSLTLDLELIRIWKAPPTPPNLLVPPAGAQRLVSGVTMLVLEKGLGERHTSNGSKVTLTYSAWDYSGKLLESTVRAGHPVVLPFTLTPPAWREPLGLMVPGEKVRLWVPALLIADKPPGARVYDLQLIRVD